MVLVGNFIRRNELKITSDKIIFKDKNICNVKNLIILLIDLIKVNEKVNVRSSRKIQINVQLLELIIRFVSKRVLNLLIMIFNFV